jgi:hypothetical protein
MSREQAARHAGMDRQTLRDWVIRFNAAGVEGLRERPPELARRPPAGGLQGAGAARPRPRARRREQLARPGSVPPGRGAFWRGLQRPTSGASRTSPGRTPSSATPAATAAMRGRCFESGRSGEGGGGSARLARHALPRPGERPWRRLRLPRACPRRLAEGGGAGADARRERARCWPKARVRR